jgi:predicted RNase H-like nuclease (RuvC/YqgF family)
MYVRKLTITSDFCKMKSIHWKKEDPKAEKQGQQPIKHDESISVRELNERLARMRKRIRDLEEREEVLRSIIRNLEELLARTKFVPVSYDSDIFPESDSCSN